ncbi:hypothetical protein BGZ63DRAFT_422102 [Mariannaea sp. PMI_226]|nr:hypothetical protein BGZ63DRAFT_422102 [Mariannaea sp. PMI_226]
MNTVVIAIPVLGVLSLSRAIWHVFHCCLQKKRRSADEESNDSLKFGFFVPLRLQKSLNKAGMFSPLVLPISTGSCELYINPIVGTRYGGSNTQITAHSVVHSDESPSTVPGTDHVDSFNMSYGSSGVEIKGIKGFICHQEVGEEVLNALKSTGRTEVLQSEKDSDIFKEIRNIV